MQLQRSKPIWHGCEDLGHRRIGKGKSEPAPYQGGQIEIYSRDQYFTFTGQHVPDTPTAVEYRQSELRMLHKRLFSENTKPKVKPVAQSAGGCLTDAELLNRARNAVNGGHFSRLFEGEWVGDYPSQSEADLALCSHLAFWTGNARPWMDSLFRQSGLMREKWEREDYRCNTMDRAIAGNQSVLRHKERTGTENPARCEKATGSSGHLPAEELASSSVSPPDAVGGSTTAPFAGGRSPTTKLLQLIRHAEFFRTPDGKPYATVLRDGHHETHSIRSRGFRNYLQWLYYQSAGSALSGKALSEAVGVLEGKALFDGKQSAVSCRFAAKGNAIYIDLGGAEWEAVEVTSCGWTIVQNPPVRFRRTQGMLEIPPPQGVARGSAHLRQILNTRPDSNDDKLVTAWLLAAMRPAGPYPPLVLISEHGSGKSTLSKVLRTLIDPNEAPVRAQPKDAHDLMIAAENSWVIALDNLSHVPDWLSDAICRLSTGGGFSTRLLYTNDDEALFNAQRPAILNGIDDIITKADLMDRALLIQLPRIPDRKRLTEREFWATFDSQRAGILGYLLDGVSSAMRELPNVHLQSLPRMADFVEWVQAAEPRLAWESGLFRRAYEENREEANEIVINAATIARSLVALGDWSGSATDLLSSVNARASTADKAQKGWPKSARAMSAAVRRAVEILRTAGMSVTFGRETDSGRGRIITVRRGDPDAA